MKFKNQEEMDAELARWREQLPEVKSAYKPSGKTTATALLFMLVAVPLASIAGILSGGLAGVVVGIPLGLFFGLIVFLWVRVSPKFAMTGCLPVLAVIGGLIVGVVLFGAAGFVAASGVVLLGKIGKNRSPGIASAFSIVAGLLIILAAWLIATMSTPEVRDFVRGGWGITAAIAAALLTSAVATWTAIDKVNQQKFCEDCEKYIKEQDLKQLSYEGTVRTVKALWAGNIREAVNLMKEAGGDSGVPKLYMCSQCRVGYLDLTTNFEASWETGDQKKPTDEKSESWLVASVRVDTATAREINV